jgi:hypothetical protein
MEQESNKEVKVCRACYRILSLDDFPKKIYNKQPRKVCHECTKIRREIAKKYHCKHNKLAYNCTEECREAMKSKHRPKDE